MEVVKGGKNANIEEANVISEIKENPVAEYDRSKRYTWSPADRFVLNGDQFGSIINALRAIMGMLPFDRLMQANDSIENVMKNAVESGIVKESPEK